MSGGSRSLVAVEGVDGAAVEAAARDVLGRAGGRRRGGISRWDASGIFRELAVAGDEAGVPSARTLLLLYAADLAFRVRWEIRPALAEGRFVVVAPYTETAIAFGMACDVPRKWVTALFQWAPRASPDSQGHSASPSTTVGTSTSSIRATM